MCKSSAVYTLYILYITYTCLGKRFKKTDEQISLMGFYMHNIDIYM